MKSGGSHNMHKPTTETEDMYKKVTMCMRYDVLDRSGSGDWCSHVRSNIHNMCHFTGLVSQQYQPA